MLLSVVVGRDWSRPLRWRPVNCPSIACQLPVCCSLFTLLKQRASKCRGRLQSRPYYNVVVRGYGARLESAPTVAPRQLPVNCPSIARGLFVICPWVVRYLPSSSNGQASVGADSNRALITMLLSVVVGRDWSRPLPWRPVNCLVNCSSIVRQMSVGCSLFTLLKQRASDRRGRLQSRP